MASGALNVKPLITHRFAIDDAIDAYKLLDDSSALGIVLGYPEKANQILRVTSVDLPTDTKSDKKYTASAPTVGFIGAGNYASRALIPAFKTGGAILDTLVTSGGISGVHHGKKSVLERHQ
jgi:hypothetical protein